MRMVRANDACGKRKQSVSQSPVVLPSTEQCRWGRKHFRLSRSMLSSLEWTWTPVLGWLAHSLGADIHRSVLRNRTEQVDADPFVNHPRAVSLCWSVCRCGSSWCGGKKGAWQGGCCGGGGRGGCGSRKGTLNAGSCEGGGHWCGPWTRRVTWRRVLLWLLWSWDQEVSLPHGLPGMAGNPLALSQKPQFLPRWWVLPTILLGKR